MIWELWLKTTATHRISKVGEVASAGIILEKIR